MRRATILARHSESVLIYPSDDGRMRVYGSPGIEASPYPVIDVLRRLFDLLWTIDLQRVEFCSRDEITIQIKPKSDGVSLEYRAEVHVEPNVKDDRVLVGANVRCESCMFSRREGEGSEGLRCYLPEPAGRAGGRATRLIPCTFFYSWDHVTVVGETKPDRRLGPLLSLIVQGARIVGGDLRRGQ